MRDDVEVIAQAGRTGLTFVARLAHAPFPIEDRDGTFFDSRDPATGERAHTGPEGLLPESRHFRDDRVLFHLPPSFDPGQPLSLLVFFHGHRSELRRTLIGELELTRQIDESGRNVILVAPQFALDAADSHPGKLAEAGGLSRFLDEAAGILAGVAAGLDRAAIARAPVILAAFSGGYRSAAHCVERGGADGRIAGVILLDAIYGEVERFQSWLDRATRRSFFLCLYGESSRDGTEALAGTLARVDIAVSDRYPARFEPGGVYLVPVETPHDRVPLDGPPDRPIAAILRHL